MLVKLALCRSIRASGTAPPHRTQSGSPNWFCSAKRTSKGNLDHNLAPEHLENEPKQVPELVLFRKTHEQKAPWAAQPGPPVRMKTHSFGGANADCDPATEHLENEPTRFVKLVLFCN